MKFLRGLGLEGLNIEIQEDAGIVAVGESAGDILNNMLDIVEGSFDLSIETSMMSLSECLGESFVAGFEADETDTEEKKEGKLAAIAAKVKAFADKVWKFIKAIYAKIKSMFTKLSAKTDSGTSGKDEPLSKEESPDEKESDDANNKDERYDIRDVINKAYSDAEKSVFGERVADLVHHYIKNPPSCDFLHTVREGYAKLVETTKEIIDLYSQEKLIEGFITIEKATLMYSITLRIDKKEAAIAALKQHPDSIAIFSILQKTFVDLEYRARKATISINTAEKASAEQLAKDGVTMEDISRFRELALLDIKLATVINNAHNRIYPPHN